MLHPAMARLPTVPRAEMIVVPFGINRAELPAKPLSVMVFSVAITNTSLAEGVSTTENQGMSPPQYSSTDVLGVPPPMIVSSSLSGCISHRSEERRVGKESG